MNISNQPVTIYISAASDLMSEREVLARTIAELPVTLAWHIAQTPLDFQVLNAETITASALYFLVFGSDIRAPVGLEFETALQHNILMRGYFKRGAAHTPAGQAFVQRVRHQFMWDYYDSLTHLSRQIQIEVGAYLLRNQVVYALSPAEVGNLESLLRHIAADGKLAPEQHLAVEGTGHSAILLSRERFMPSEGVLIENPPEE